MPVSTPERMSLRPRLYMAIVALLRFWLGGLVLLFGGSYNPPYWHGQYAHEVWAITLMCVGGLAFISSFNGNPNLARWALLLAMVTSGLWLGQMIADGWAFGVAFLVGLVLKDGTMLRNPLRDPFDKLVARKIVAVSKN